MTNEREFVLIYHQNHPATGAKAPPELSLLKVPPGYHLECMIFGGNSNIAQDYNSAMRQAVARYKIYLQEGAAVVYRDFLDEILALFEKYPDLGLLGVMGAKRLPSNGIWWEAPETYGQIDYQGMWIRGSEEITNDYVEVQAVDGIMMATQYDLPWREDLFTSRYFYDIAQSLEFIKAGFKVGVAKQRSPWLARKTTDDLILFQKYRRVFVKEYGGMLGS